MEDSIFLKRIGRGAVAIFAGVILSKLFMYAFRALVARYFGADSYGLLALAVAVISTIASFSLMGLSQGVLRYAAFFLGKKENEKIAPLIGSVVKVVLPISLVMAVVLFMFADFISVRFFHKPELVLFLKIFAFSTPLMVLYNLFENVLQALQDAKSLVVSKSIVDPLSKLLLLILAVVVGIPAWGAAFAYVFGMAVALAFMLVFVKNRVPRFWDIFSKPSKLSKELVSYSLPLLLTNFSLMIFSWADIIILGVFVSSDSVGIYDAASVTSRLLAIIPVAFSTMFMPAITEVFAQEKSSVSKIYKQVSNWILVFMIPIMAMLALFSGSFLGKMFGSVFSQGSNSLIILLVGQLLWGIAMLASNVLAMLKYTKLIFLNNALAAVLNIVLNIILIPKWGIFGAAFATAVSLFVMSLLMVVEAFYFIGSWPLSLSVLKMLAAITIPTVAIAVAYGSFPVNTGLFGIALLSSLAGLSYFVLLLVFRTFSKEEIGLLKSAFRKYTVQGPLEAS